MSIGNSIRNAILRAVAHVVLFFYKSPAPDLPVIEIEAYDEGKLQGYGFLVNGEIVLTHKQEPLLFQDKAVAQECLVEKYYGKGQVVYQKWEPNTRQVKIGTVLDGSRQL